MKLPPAANTRATKPQAGATTGRAPWGGVGAWVSGPQQRPPRVWRRRATYPQRWSSRIFGRVWSLNRNPNQGPDDDRRDDEPSYAAGEELGRRFSARDGGFCRAAPDGVGSRKPDRRRASRTQPGPHQSPQRLSRPDVGDPRRGGRAAHPKAAQEQLFPGLSGTASDG